MKYLGYRDDESMIGLVVDDRLYPLCPIEEFYADNPQGRLAEAVPSGEGKPLADLELIPPVPPSSQVLCIGLNYAAHIEETGRDRPDAPEIFGRWYSTLASQNAEVAVPAGESGLDWEGELAVIVGKYMHDVDDNEAMDGILGYTCFNDISARTFQMTTSQWTLGKNAANSGPIGPVVVSATEYGDPYGRQLETRYNGAVVQSSTTGHMIFKIAEVLAYASRCVTLKPGDVLATGTPDGVGFRRDPPVLMVPGDHVEVEIEGIGILRSLIV